MTTSSPCRTCGNPLYPDEAYCPGCGATAARLADRTLRRSARVALAISFDAEAPVSTCARCRSEVLSGGRYCQMCGALQPPA